MPGLFDSLPVLIAQNAAPAAGGNQAAIMQFLPFIAIIGFWFYFLLLRPQQKEQKQRRTMMETLGKNDRVLTSSGIYGTVVSVDEGADRIVLRVDDDKGMRITFSRASIARVLDGAAEKGKEKKTSETS